MMLINLVLLSWFLLLFVLHYNLMSKVTFKLFNSVVSQIRRRFVNSSLKQRASSAHAYEFRRDFGQVLASQMVRHQTLGMHLKWDTYSTLLHCCRVHLLVMFL